MIIGRAEKIDFPSLEIKRVPAKVDTGADASSIWVSSTRIENGELICIFFGPSSKHYTGKEVIFTKEEYTQTRVANSFGQREIRYKVKLTVKILGKTINATFTLSNRENKTYPVLIGRKLLHKKFIVDVSKGSPLVQEEKAKRLLLQNDLQKMEHKE